MNYLKNIQEFLNSGNITISKPRKNRPNSNPMCVIEISDLHVLKHRIIPIFKKSISQLPTLNSKKVKDLIDWCIWHDIFYNGYHTLPYPQPPTPQPPALAGGKGGRGLGRDLINDIMFLSKNWNNYRLSTYKSNEKSLL